MNLRGGRWSVLLVMPLLALAVGLIWWRGPDWRVVHDAFTVVRWPWVVAAIGLNLLSVVARDAVLGDDDHAVDPEAASAVPADLLGVLGRPLRERRAARAGSASWRGSPCCGGGCRGIGKGTTRDPDRLGVRPPDVRPVPGGDARHLGAAGGEDPGLGGHGDRDRAGRRRPAVPRRVGERADPAPRRARRARHAAADARRGRARASP